MARRALRGAPGVELWRPCLEFSREELHISLFQEGVFSSGNANPDVNPRLSAIVPLGYPDPAITRMDEITGGGPYGATTMSDKDGSRMPSENELYIARLQGRRIAELAVRLAG